MAKGEPKQTHESILKEAYKLVKKSRLFNWLYVMAMLLLLGKEGLVEQ
jgi:hypothetical protein